jgi:hypothetical protein
MTTNQLIIEKVSPFNLAVMVKKLIEAAHQKGWQDRKFFRKCSSNRINKR